MKKILTESEYKHFLSYGKHLSFFYRQYAQLDQKIQEIEENKEEIEAWIKEEYPRSLLHQVKRTRITKKRFLSDFLYLDFIRMTKYAYKVDEYIQTVQMKKEGKHGLQK